MTLRIKYLFTLTIVVMIVLVACQNYNQHKQKGFNKNNYQALTLLQNNCFSCSGSAVIVGGIGNIHTCQIANQALIFENAAIILI